MKCAMLRCATATICECKRYLTAESKQGLLPPGGASISDTLSHLTDGKFARALWQMVCSYGFVLSSNRVRS